MINAYSCIANDGMLMRPGFGQCHVPINLGRPITQETARTMKAILRINEDVQGKEMFESLHGLPAAGQAGTAQKKINDYYSASEYYVSFAGFVPVDKPVFCVLVLVDAPKPVRIGRIVAYPAFAKIALATARTLGVSKLSISSEGKEKIKEGPI
jgi:cell division protein FtsI/penicillin-binding protein 2